MRRAREQYLTAYATATTAQLLRQAIDAQRLILALAFGDGLSASVFHLERNGLESPWIASAACNKCSSLKPNLAGRTTT